MFGTGMLNTRRVKFSPVVEVVEYLVDNVRDDLEDSSRSPSPEPKTSPPAIIESGQKRGRPPDTPLQQAEKRMKKAEEKYLSAKKALIEKRDQLRNEGAWFDEPSVVERLKERMHSRVLKVAELELEWEERREEHVQARIAEVRHIADGWEAAWSAEKEVVEALKAQLVLYKEMHTSELEEQYRWEKREQANGMIMKCRDALVKDMWLKGVL